MQKLTIYEVTSDAPYGTIEGECEITKYETSDLNHELSENEFLTESEAKAYVLSVYNLIVAKYQNLINNL